MYEITTTTKFDRDLKRIKKRGYDLSLLSKVVNLLATGEQLPAAYRDHKLTGNYKDFRECHITPDWLLIYQISNGTLLLVLQRTGTHNDLFD